MLFSNDFSLMTWDDGVDNGLTYEAFISRFLPQDNFIHEETHVHNKTVNNFYNVRPRTRHGGNFNNGGNFNGGGINGCDWVEVHVNNLRKCVNDHIKSQQKKGYQLKRIEQQKNGNYKVITKKGKQTFTRIFEVKYI